MEINKEKKDILYKDIHEIDKKYGKNSVFFVNEADKDLISIQRWELDSPNFMDIFNGGLPKGRIIEIYGPESSGKTTSACYIVGQVQKAGGVAAYIDAEHALDFEYASIVGMDVDNLMFSQPMSGEEALGIVEDLITHVDVIVVDSVSALTPQAEIDGEMGQSHMGLQARLMSQAMRKLAAKLSVNNCTLIFINQIRMKIGVMFGNPETTSGGNALKFYSSVRLETRKAEWLTEGSEKTGKTTGIKIRLKGVKNKVGKPNKKQEIDLDFETGFEVESAWVKFAVLYGVVDKSGSWYSYKDERIGQGIKNAGETLKGTDLLQEIIKETKERMLPSKVEEVTEEKKAPKKRRAAKAEKEEVMELNETNKDPKEENATA